MEMVFLWISVSKAKELCFYISSSPLLILLLNTAIPLQSLSLPPASSSHSHEGFSSLNCPEQQRRAEGGWRFHLGGSKGCQGTLGRSAPWCGTGGGSCRFACAQWICLYSRVLELSRLTEISWWLRHSLQNWEVIQSKCQTHGKQVVPVLKTWAFIFKGIPKLFQKESILFPVKWNICFNTKYIYPFSFHLLWWKKYTPCKCWIFRSFLLTFLLQLLRKIGSLFTHLWSNAGAFLCRTLPCGRENNVGVF